MDNEICNIVFPTDTYHYSPRFPVSIMVWDTSNRPQYDFGNYLGPYSRKSLRPKIVASMVESLFLRV